MHEMPELETLCVPVGMLMHDELPYYEAAQRLGPDYPPIVVVRMGNKGKYRVLDGYHRLASNRAEVLVRGRRVPVAGRVCMDHTMIDVTDVGEVAAGEPVVLFGVQNGTALGADVLAGWCDTIPYEVLTSVGRRVPRRYVEEEHG